MPNRKSIIKIACWLICLSGLLFLLPAKTEATLYETSWCGTAGMLPDLDTCPSPAVEKTASIPDSLTGDNFDGNKAIEYCGGGTNIGCMKGKRKCTEQICTSMTFCCKPLSTGGPAAEKCATTVTNGCGVASPNPNMDYKCVGMAQQTACTGGGGEWAANDSMGKFYPSCGPDGCCKTPKCAAPAATTATSTAKKPPAEYALANPLGTTSIPAILGKIIKTFLGIVGALALAVFVFGGAMWMTARGDAAQVKKGQDALKNAAIGLFLIMFSYGLTSSFVGFWTKEQKDIAVQENRTVEPETPAVASAKENISSAADKAAADKAKQEAAVTAGEQAGVTTPDPNYCLTPPKLSDDPAQAKAEQDAWTVACQNIPAQSTYNTPAPGQGFGGQPNCPPPNPYLTGQDQIDAQSKYNECMKTKSTIGWKTVCGQTVFDTGYGTYNNAACTPVSSCTGKILSADCWQLGQIVMAATADPIMAAAAQAAINAGCFKIFGIGPSFGNNCGGDKVCCKP